MPLIDPAKDAVSAAAGDRANDAAVDSTNAFADAAVQEAANSVVGNSADSVAADPQTIAGLVGNPLTRHVSQARVQRLALPAALSEFAESSGQARALVLAQLVSREPAVRARQLARLQETLGAAEMRNVAQALPMATQLDPWLRLPALLLIYPGLRRLSRSERVTLLALIDELMRSDNRIEVFEFCLAKLVSVSLRDELAARDPHGADKLTARAAEIATLFAVVAAAGAADEVDARRAYEAGLSRVLPGLRPAFVRPVDWPVALDTALTRLETLHPFAKRAVVEGLVTTIAHDGQLVLAEAELLRAVCASLQCPLPPLLPDAA